MLKEKTTEEKSSSSIISCKFCQADIELKEMRQLPKKLIIEKHGLCWTGLERVFLNIYKIQCPSCKKKYSHKVFNSEFIYK